MLTAGARSWEYGIEDVKIIANQGHNSSGEEWEVGFFKIEQGLVMSHNCYALS